MTDYSQKIKYAIQYLDSRLAREILVNAKDDPTIEIDSEDFDKLSYLRLSSLSPNRLQELIKKGILIAYKMPGFDLKAKLIDYIEELEDTMEQVNMVKFIQSILVSNAELLGNRKISYKDGEVAPSLANWIADFQIHKRTKENGSFQIIQYLNTSPNAKLLDKNNKYILKEVLSLYDLVTDYSEFWDKLPSELSEADQKEFADYINRVVLEENQQDIVANIKESNQVLIDQKLEELKHRQQNHIKTNKS